MNQDLTSLIRSKADIVDIIGERLPLVARGRNYFGVCPFHEDNDPSFCVSREKQIYTCFSCHATGNVYTFLMNYDHLDFREALKYLGERVGVDTSEITVKKKATKFDHFYDAYSVALKYYQNNLSSQLGKEAKKYLYSRAITEDVIKEFEIGFSLDKRDDLTILLQNKGYSLQDLNKIGLSNDDHDIYNDRIMFPLYDIYGKVVGFSGRIYKDTDQNKYLNTKETDIFKKRELLYHYHIAKDECRKTNSVIIMEGFMDVIRAHTIGVRNTIALMGTALTKEAIDLISRLSNQVILCFDGDEAGVRATLHNGEELLKKGVNVKVLSLPAEDDPDSYIIKYGKDRFLGLLENVVDYNDFKLEKAKENVNFQSDEEKANYINLVLKEYAKITDPIRIEILLKKLAKEFDIGYNTLEMQLSGFQKEIPVEKPKVYAKAQKRVRKDKYQKAVEQVLYFMLNNDWVINEVERESIPFPSGRSRLLSSEIIYYYQKYGQITIADFCTYIQGDEEIQVLLNEILAGNYNDETTEEDLALYFQVIRDYNKKCEIKRLVSLMRKELDPLEQAKIGNKIMKLREGE